jgi:1-acyl-sn-glycerol-3-phosphate acyltransferase
VTRTNQFFPEHPCDLRCIAENDIAAPVGSIRYFSRRLAMTAVYGLVRCLGVLSVFCSRRTNIRIFRMWSRAWLKASGVRIEISGELCPDKPVLLVANHMSYFDMITMMAAHPFITVSAAEMRTDAFVGRILRNIGTIFVARENLSSLPGLVADTGAALRRGDSVVVFPEGRIRCSAPGGPFAPSVMQAAINTGAPVRPVLMWCELPGGQPTSRASWLGSESLRHSLRRLQRIRGLTVQIRVFPDIDPAAVRNRTELARRARASFSAASEHLPASCVSRGLTDLLEASLPSIEVPPQ